MNFSDSRYFAKCRHLFGDLEMHSLRAHPWMRGADHEEVVSVRIAEELPRDVWVLSLSPCVCKQNF